MKPTLFTQGARVKDFENGNYRWDFKFGYYQCVYIHLSVPYFDIEFLCGFTLWLDRTSHFCLFVSQVITVPQQQSVKVTSFGIERTPAFNKLTTHSSEEVLAFTDMAKSQLVEMEPATHNPQTSLPSQKLRVLHETFKEDKKILKQGDNLTSFSTAHEADVSSMTPEKELGENSATESSVHSGLELLLKEREILIAGKQPSSDSEFSATLAVRGKSVANTGPESGQCLPLREEKACAQIQSSLFYSPSSPMSSDDESEIEDEDLKAELQRLREK